MKPLAERVRPESLDEFVGNKEITDAQWLKRGVLEKNLPSLIIYGDPGVGKTTLARIIIKELGLPYKIFSAVTSGIKEVRDFIEEADKNHQEKGTKTVLFVDEIHRFNKAQQDAFLPWIEKGVIILIGATTENPGFYINAPLLSRVKTINLKKLTKDDIKKIVCRGLQDADVKERIKDLPEEIIDFISDYANGDGRVALNALELISFNYREGLSVDDVHKILQKKSLPYDKKGDSHYNLISAFIKSMRGSDPDAAVYYLARMLESGEDPYFILRRMVIFASEDIGNADPHALMVVVSAFNAFDLIGMPEGFIPLSQAVCYLALAPKSNSSYLAYLKAKEDVNKHGSLTPPLYILNPVTRIMKAQGYGKGYKYPHDYPGGYIKGVTYLPEDIKNKRYYEPKDIGYEKILKERLKKIKE
ncbi:MAG: replication-associated recombination protein A [Proteobacteria bacterium]|nr:replication-associated recombination protein A [Pseudomonadota bacterium]